MSPNINYLTFFKKNKQKIKQYNNFPDRGNSVNSEISTNNKLIPYSNEVSIYPAEDLLRLDYFFDIFEKIINLHYKTIEVDYCIQSIQNKPIFEHVYNHCYNLFRAKFNALLTISYDQGENLSLALSRSARSFSVLTYFLKLFPLPFSLAAELIQLAISEFDKRNKVAKSKNVLKFLKTDENFTKIVSLLFSYLVLKDQTYLEYLDKFDKFIEKKFSVFWKILNEQAQQVLESKKSDTPINIVNLWAYCFCLFTLTLMCNSKNPLNAVKSIQQPTTNFFLGKRLRSLPFGEANPAIHRSSSGPSISLD